MTPPLCCQDTHNSLPPDLRKQRTFFLWVKRVHGINLFVHIACLFRRHTIHPSVPECWLDGSLKLLTTLSFHMQIGARKTLRLSPVFFRRGNIVAYEVYPRRDHCWLKTLPNTPPGWLEIQSALAIFVGLLGGLITCWKKKKKQLCFGFFRVLFSLRWWKALVRWRSPSERVWSVFVFLMVICKHQLACLIDPDLNNVSRCPAFLQLLLKCDSVKERHDVP